MSPAGDPGDPVMSLLAVLPFAAAFALVAARRIGARIAPFEIGLWLGWIALALAHRRLGFAGSAMLVAAFGAALAAARTVALVPALVRAQRGARRVRATTAAFAAALAFLVFLWPWGRQRVPDGDEPYYLLLTESLTSDLDVDLADEYRDRAWQAFSPVPIAPQPGDPVGPRGEAWSRHGAFLPLLLAPLYLAFGVRGAELGLVALAAALAAAVFAALGARWPGKPRAAAVIWAGFVVAPPLFVYSGRFWVEVPAALAVAVVLATLPRLGTAGALPRSTWIPLFAALVALPLLKLRFLAIAIPLALVALHRLGVARSKERLRLALGLGGALLALALFNLARFGNPLRMYAGGELDPTAVSVAGLARGLSGLAFDVAYGLVAAAPLWLLLAPALAAAVRRRTLPLVELAATAPYLYFIAGRREWYGGWSPPFRYGIVLLPILALTLVPLFHARERSRRLSLLLAALSAATAVTAVVAHLHPAWTFSLADGASRGLSELASIFPGDLVRLTPSSVRPRLATALWLLALPLAVVLAWPRRAPGPRRVPAALGVALALGGLAAAILAAQRLPTRIVEVEDAWVAKRGGEIFPGRWTIDRTRFDGGWIVNEGSAIELTPVSGGESCRATVRAAFYGEPGADQVLELTAGDRSIAKFAPPDPAERERWGVLVTDDFAMPPGTKLALRARSERGSNGAPFWVVDRLELDWR